MLVKIGIVNFQSLKKVKLQFETGVTVVTGPNSSGKTAIFRAIRALVTNPRTGKAYIKQGTDTSAVAISVNGGRPVQWSRTLKGTSYKVGSEVNTKTGNTDVFDVCPEFPMILEKGTGRLLNLHSENDVLFPFDKSPGDLFKLFEDIFQVVESSKVLDGFKSDEKRLKEELTVHGCQQDTITKKLLKLTETRAIVDVSRLGLMKKYLQEAQESLRDSSFDLTKATEYAAFLTSSKLELYVFPEGLENQADATSSLSGALALANWLELSSSLKVREVSFERVSRITNAWSAQAQALILDAQLSALGPLTRKDFDFSNVSFVDEASRALDQALQLSTFLGVKIPTKVSFPEGTLSIAEMISKEQKTAQLLLADCLNLLSETDALGKLNKKIEDELGDFSACPLCARPFNDKHTHP